MEFLKEEPSPAKLSRIAGGTEDMDTEERMGSINMSIREFNKRFKKR